jgi:hypothetical protein
MKLTFRIKTKLNNKSIIILLIKSQIFIIDSNKESDSENKNLIIILKHYKR